MEERSYTVLVEGELGPKFSSAFPGMRLERRNGMTAIVGSVADQAQLQGILAAVASFSLKLVSVTPSDDAAAT